MKKTVYTILITAIIILAQSCKSDMVKENFRFADQQIEYALQLVDSVIQNDNRDDDTKAKNPLV
ncbi:MAG: glucuronyl hydrolase, partial [Fermentimonas sp.]|nr:glucuronyl hydrolase [Fermentimonas sp.]